MELQQRLQAALGDTYRILRELGGGGMSRVFLAEEIRLGRQVVIKVLPPEMGAAVNVERFEREIQLAARLQHPHIVPLLTAGPSGDLLYYVMPFIAGESLREQAGPRGRAAGGGGGADPARGRGRARLRPRATASSTATSSPTTCCSPAATRVVTDFGVAKAVSASSGTSSLTSLGRGAGHAGLHGAGAGGGRSPRRPPGRHLRAWARLAYEMLSGRPPFTAPHRRRRCWRRTSPRRRSR